MGDGVRLGVVDRVGSVRFDAGIWRRLSSLDLRLLELLAYLSRQTAQRSASGAHYCFPGRVYLARRLGCSVETVSEHTRRLCDLGLLRKVQRRPVGGRWRSNLYRLVHPMAWAAARVMASVVRVARRVPSKAHIASSLTRRETDKRQSESLRDIIRRGLQRWGPAST